MANDDDVLEPCTGPITVLPTKGDLDPAVRAVLEAAEREPWHTTPCSNGGRLLRRDRSQWGQQVLQVVPAEAADAIAYAVNNLVRLTRERDEARAGCARLAAEVRGLQARLRDVALCGGRVTEQDLRDARISAMANDGSAEGTGGGNDEGW